MGILTILGLLICSAVLYKTLYRLLGRMFWIRDWRAKAVLVTGCDSGFGRALAEKLAAKGVLVVAGCLTEIGIDSLRKNLAFKRNLFPINMNIASDISVESARRMASDILVSQGAKLWGLVCNAGIEKINGPDDWLSLGHYREHMEVNTFGTIRTVHNFKDLIKDSRGRIVIMTSIKGRLVFLDSGPYTAAKWALESYVDLIRRDLKDYRVSVHAIQPGGFKTNIVNNVAENLTKVWHQLPSHTRQEYGEDFYNDQMKMWRGWSEKTQSEDLSPVVQAYSEALFSRFPRYRYVVGWDSWLHYLPVSYLSEFWQDIYVRIAFPRLRPQAAIGR